MAAHVTYPASELVHYTTCFLITQFSTGLFSFLYKSGRTANQINGLCSTAVTNRRCRAIQIDSQAQAKTLKLSMYQLYALATTIESLLNVVIPNNDNRNSE